MTTSQDAKTQLVEAAMRLRAAAPSAWDDLLKALDTRRQLLDTNCITCMAPDQLTRSQGQAVECRMLLNDLLTAPDMYAQLMRGKNSVSRTSR